VLQTAVDGLFASLASWARVAVHLRSLAADQARHEADIILQRVPDQLRSVPAHNGSARWIADPSDLHRVS